MPLFFSCQKAKVSAEIELDQIKALGHAGMGDHSIYPRNSLESVSHCLDAGASGSEIDVQLTSDSVLVAFHDETLSTKTDLEGIIHSLTWEEIKNGHYNFGPYKKFKIMSLEDLFSSSLISPDHILTFDCKLITESDEEEYKKLFSRALCSFIQIHDIVERVNIESSDMTFLRLLRNSDLPLNLFVYSYNAEEGLTSALTDKLTGVTIANDLISEEQVKALHAANIKVAIWKVEAYEENLVAVEKGPDYIQTDDIKSLIKIKNNKAISRISLY